MSNFVHLHVHSEFSLLDGANRIKDLPVRAKELGMDSIAITDHGVMYGAIDFYKACKKEGVKPIIGCEVYVAPRTRFQKEPGIDNKYNHLILLAKNNEGYKNLSKMVSIGFTEGYYYKPRIDLETIEKYHEGVICLSACLAGSVNQAILNGDMQKAEERALWFKNVFKDDYYLEIQNNGIKEQVLANQKLIELSRKLDIPLVATNDAHYLKKEDAYNHEVLLCIQTGKRMSDTDRMKFDTEELYIKSPEEMIDYFKNFPEAIENTVKIANECNVEFEFGNTILPNYDVPEEFETHYDYLKKLCDDGLIERYGENYSEDIKKRAEYEIGIIKKMGYVDYYLIVWDFIHYAKSHGIPVGPGRGSGAGSILAYAIGITDIDPMKYNLLFERFLNPERISMPDFDVDFCYERRQDVIDYVCRKYGHDHVSQIITFGTMSARMVIRDVGRVLDFPYAECDKLAKMIPNELHITIKKALEQNKELNNLYETDENIKKLLDIAMALEGMPRQASTHACGVVITKDPVDTYVPLYVRDGQISTQYIMTTLEELGLLKMDFLGLRTLTVIKDCMDLVKQCRGIDVEFDKDMSDPKVYKLWQEGKTSGIFQFESQGMTNFMKELKPDCLEDLIAGVSLYRPGPMDQIPRYIRGKLNPGHNEYTHPALEPILNVTYGCMVYQEQVMQIVRDLAGYSLGRADLVRRAMGKKKLDVMAKEREIFIHGEVDEAGNVLVPGCVRNGIDEKSANKIFDEMAEFAKYAFNKSHAAAYAVVSYQTAYFKYYYPVEFMAALMTSVIDNTRKVSEYIFTCRQMGIKVLPPDVNEGEGVFTAVGDNIRYGLYAIKSIGRPVVDLILQEREENGTYKTLQSFLERVSCREVNKRAVENLIKAGALDGLDGNRQQMITVFSTIMDNLASEKKKSMSGQMTLFDLVPEEEKQDYEIRLPQLEEYSKEIKLGFEKEVLGIYLTGHPLEEYEERWRKNISAVTTDFVLDEETNEVKVKDNQKVTVGGMITEKTIKYTKNNKVMAFLILEDLVGTVEVIVFPNSYEKYSSLLNEDEKVFITGRANVEEDKNGKIICEQITSFDSVKRELWLQFSTKEEFEAKEQELYGRLHDSDGRDSVVIYISSIKAMKRLPNNYNICINQEIVNNLTNFLGENNVKVVEKIIEKRA